MTRCGETLQRAQACQNRRRSGTKPNGHSSSSERAALIAEQTIDAVSTACVDLECGEEIDPDLAGGNDPSKTDLK